MPACQFILLYKISDMVVIIKMLVNYIFLLGMLAASQDFNYTKEGKDWPGLCKTGKAQSPINIDYSEVVLAASHTGVIFGNYTNGTGTGNFTSEGLNIVGDFGNMSAYTRFGIDSGVLSGILVFAPSQHTIAGKHADMEVLFGTQITGEENYIAVSVLLNEGADNEFFDQILNTTKGVPGQVINAGNLMNRRIRDFYRYSGSLSIPPCVEIVTWFIIPDFGTVGKTQLEEFQSHWAKDKNFAGGHGNNRAVQKLHGRQITLYRGD